MEVKKVLSFSEEEEKMLEAVGKFFKTISTAKEERAYEVLSQDAGNLLFALKNVLDKISPTNYSE